MQLAKENEIKIHVLYGSLIKTETGGTGTPPLPPTSPNFFQPLPPNPIGFQRRGGGVGSEAGTLSGKAISGCSAGRQKKDGGEGALMYKDVPQQLISRRTLLGFYKDTFKEFSAVV